MYICTSYVHINTMYVCNHIILFLFMCFYPLAIKHGMLDASSMDVPKRPAMFGDTKGPESLAGESTVYRYIIYIYIY